MALFDERQALFNRDPRLEELQTLESQPPPQDMGGVGQAFSAAPAPAPVGGPIAPPPEAGGPDIAQIGVQTAAGAATGAAAGGPVGAAVGGGLALVGGLLAQAAAAKRQKRTLKFQAEQAGFQAERRAKEQLAQGTQSALRDILSGLSRSLG